MANRPNILLVMADQLAPQFLPCYGHPIVKAPTLQRLSDEGVTFDAAYTNSPLCASRTAHGAFAASVSQSPLNTASLPLHSIG